MDNNGDGGNRNRNPQYGSEDRSESLRDFLRVKEEDNAVVQYNNRRSNSLAGLTLNAVLSDKGGPRSGVQQRTLLDIIRDDHTVPKETKRSWKAFRDKLRLRRAGSAWTSSVPIPTSDIPIGPPRNMSVNNRMSMTRRSSTRYPNAPAADETDGVPGRSLNSMSSSRSMLLRRNTSRVPERQMSRINIPSEDDEPGEEAEEEGEVHGGDGGEDDDEGEEGGGEGVGESGGGGGGEPPVRMSLMALLAETGNGGYLDEEEEDEEEEEESGGGVGGGGVTAGGEYNNCCVCMVRHKGAAFIPCGHTFCRLCSRELWVQRGNCPLCNNFILEILDIF